MDRIVSPDGLFTQLSPSNPDTQLLLSATEFSDPILHTKACHLLGLSPCLGATDDTKDALPQGVPSMVQADGLSPEDPLISYQDMLIILLDDSTDNLLRGLDTTT